MALRLGLVGVGDAGRHHGRALGALHGGGNVEWAAVCARSAESVARFGADVGMPVSVTTFVGLEDLLDRGACDAVVLATPDGLHAAQIEQCAAAGVHVLCEKPLALEAAEAVRAVAVCESRGVLLSVGYHLRHHAGHALVRARAREWIGELTQVTVHWAWPDPSVEGWRAQGRGARYWSLSALGTHGIDLALWLIGRPVVRACGLRVMRDGIDVASSTSLEHEGGALSDVWASVTHRAASRLIVTGHDGAIECLHTLGARGAGEIWLRRNGQEPERISFAPVNPYKAQLSAFVEAASAGGVGNADDGVANLAAIELAHPPEESS